MVRARLHVICGNCGCNNEFTFEIDPKGHDMTGHDGTDIVKYEPAVWLRCGNCSTIHDLSENMKINDQ